MDLQLYARILWRFRLLVVAGLTLALSLSLLSLMRIGTDGASWRQSELWGSTSRLLVTQKGFPWGRAVADEAAVDEQAQKLGIRFADPNRFNSLAVLYAQLATGDAVRAIMLSDGPIRGEIIARPVFGDFNAMLPMIDIIAISDHPRTAILLGTRATSALRTYLTQQQTANQIAPQDRIVVQPVERARKAKIVEARSKTRPVMIFLTVLIATVALAFLLENVRPRVRPVGESGTAESLKPAARRSA